MDRRLPRYRKWGVVVGSGNEIVSSITTHSAEFLKLHEGSKVYAIRKASEVMVGID